MADTSTDFLDSDFRILLSGNLPIRNVILYNLVVCVNNTVFELTPPKDARGVYVSAFISKDLRAFCVFKDEDGIWSKCLLNGNDCFFIGDFNTLNKIKVAFEGYASNEPAYIAFNYF